MTGLPQAVYHISSTDPFGLTPTGYNEGCGGAITECGEAFIWNFVNRVTARTLGEEAPGVAVAGWVGKMIVRPMQVHQIGRVASLACGNSFFAAATAEGQVYTWGSGLHGALGLGQDEASAVSMITRNDPTHVKALKDHMVRQVCCGGGAAAAITAVGEAYTWGQGLYAQLGHGNCSNRWLPHKLEGLPGDVEGFAMGVDHTVAMVAGNVYSWGKGWRGQLGHSRPVSSATSPKVAVAFGCGLPGIGSRALQVTAGDGWTAVRMVDGRVIHAGVKLGTSTKSSAHQALPPPPASTDDLSSALPLDGLKAVRLHAGRNWLGIVTTPDGLYQPTIPEQPPSMKFTVHGDCPYELHLGYRDDPEFEEKTPCGHNHTTPEE